MLDCLTSTSGCGSGSGSGCSGCSSGGTSSFECFPYLLSRVFLGKNDRFKMKRTKSAVFLAPFFKQRRFSYLQLGR
jgi:hypothetical protein